MNNEVDLKSTPPSIPLQAPPTTHKLAHHQLDDVSAVSTVSKVRRAPVTAQSFHRSGYTGLGAASSIGKSTDGANTDSGNVESVAVPLTVLTCETAEETLEAGEERVTTREIIDLWTAHNKQNAMLKKSSKDLKKTRTSLGCYLYQLKSLLAKTGRNARWTSFI